MTYIGKTDSVTVNFTIGVDALTNVDGIVISADGIVVAGNSEKCIYRDVLKSCYEIRTSSRISFNDMERIYSSNTPAVFNIMLSNGDKCYATYSRSKWEKECFVINRIVQLIKM